jgi:hypothetical protein
MLANLSSNFAFLAAHDQGLARLGALAEWAFHHDPPTTLGKLRLFAELLAKLVAARHAIEVLPRESFEAVLRVLRDRGVLPRQAAELFHYLRRVGNAAVHAARQTTYAGEPYHSLSLLDEATAGSEAGEAPASYRRKCGNGALPDFHDAAGSHPT